ncbi:hypothetical protein EDC04DRAFT_3144586 [Pisolithus marmoratus]|nr:hypothetical protein EDC04DRAFT_3144586 [Pisolithus marmoratus]
MPQRAKESGKAYSSLLRLLTPPNVIRDLTPFNTFQREAHVLDTIRTREDLFMDVSRLHLGGDELFEDLFDLMQLRSRLGNLVRHYGRYEGVVHIISTSATGSSSTAPLDSVSSGSNRSQKRTSIPFSAISIAFPPRKVGLTLTSSVRKRTTLEVPRIPNEKLEVVAKKLVKGLS